MNVHNGGNGDGESGDHDNASVKIHFYLPDLSGRHTDEVSTLI